MNDRYGAFSAYAARPARRPDLSGRGRPVPAGEMVPETPPCMRPGYDPAADRRRYEEWAQPWRDVLGIKAPAADDAATPDCAEEAS